MTQEDRADLIRAARYLESNNDEDSSMSVLEADRIAAMLRRVAAAGSAHVPLNDQPKEN